MNIVKQKNDIHEKQDDNLTLYILKTVSITLAVLVVGFFYILSVLMALSPKSVGKMFSVIGSENAVLVCVEQEYRKNPSNINLYNVIQQSVKVGDNNRVDAYCYQLMNSKKYSKFEEEINNICREKVGKDKIAYVYDIDSYLTSVYIKALYALGEKVYARQEFHIKDMQRTDHPYTISLVTYVNCLYADETMTDEEKASEFSEYFEGGVMIQGRTIKQCLEEKLAVIETTDETTDEGKIFNIYTQIKVNTCFYKIYDILGNDTQKQVYQEKVEELQNVYNSLITE